MGSRKKKRQSYEDRISQLNDDMICHILSNLSTKDVIRTSLLSTRWRNLWQCVNALDLESNKFSSFENFAGFVDEFFDFHRDLSIQKVCLTLYDHVSSSSHLKSWIDIAIKHALQRRRMISNVLSEFSKVKELVIGCTLKDTFKNICYVSGKKNKEPRVTLSMATPCMASSLKFVELKNPIYGYDEEIELVRYFLKNSRILEKLSLRIKNNYRKKSKDRIVKEFLAMPRCSSSCQLLVL
ncbi:unnamed protein product [Cochlearia groenlandica]